MTRHDDAYTTLLKESAATLEAELALEDRGWLTLGKTANTLTASERITSVEKARIYAVKDPLCARAVRLWTDYSFGMGMTWNTPDKAAKGALDTFWGDPRNARLLTGRGQRRSSDKLLIDGEIFFALFPGAGPEATLRRIDPLEITELITDPDDGENVLFYKREWVSAQGDARTAYYRSFNNEENQPGIDRTGATVRSGLTDQALVYHLAINDIGQRGHSMLLPALDWVKLYRQFLASRVAVMLAVARFAWKVKVAGNAASVAAARSVFQDRKPEAGAVAIENMASELTPIRTDTGAANAREDGRMLKLQVFAATGWPEQYFGDISTGNLATAQTVELPVQKMCQSYQSAWASAYADIDRFILARAGLDAARTFVDRDFPEITREDATSLSTTISNLVNTFPTIAESREVQMRALSAIGLNNPGEILDSLSPARDRSRRAKINQRSKE